MILIRCFVTLLGIMVLQSTGRTNFVEANDEQICIDLCKNCGGIATFEDNRACQCHVADDNYQRGAECIRRIRRQAEELGLDTISCDLADDDADRPARCILSPLRRFRSQVDADLIAKYFMGNGLDGIRSLLGSSTSETSETKSNSGSSSAAESVGSSTTINDANIQTSRDKTDSYSAMLGAPSPVSGTNQMFIPMMDVTPFLGAAVPWLGNGIQGPETQGFVGYHDPNLMSVPSYYDDEMNLMQPNIVGSQHQDTAGKPQSIGTFDPYSAYSARPILGMAPYSYFGGASNPIHFQDGSQVRQMQPSSNNYNPIIEAQNPLLSSNGNSDKSSVEKNTPQLSDPADESETSLDGNAKTATEVLGEPNSNPSPEAKQDTDLQDENLEATKDEDEKENKPVVSSKRTAKDLNRDGVKPEENKDQTARSINYSTRRTQSRIRSKQSTNKY